jgi:hypothetical protein
MSKEDQGTKGQSESPSFDDYFSKGFDEHMGPEIEEALSPKKPEAKKEEAVKPDEKKEVKSAADTLDEECPGCPKGKKKPPPYKVIKHDGKDLAIESEDEMIELAQKGFDYTQKTQTLADERKEFDRIKAEMESSSAKLMKKLDEVGLPRPEKEQAGQSAFVPAEEKDLTDEEFARHYEFDEFTDAATKKVAKENMELRKELNKVKTYTDAIVAQQIVGQMGQHLQEARKEFPFDEINDESGQNISQKRILQSLSEKIRTAKNPNQVLLRDIVREAVKEEHFTQKAVKPKEGEVTVKDNLTVDEFKAKLPNSFKAISETISSQAVVDHEKKESDLPPSITGRKGEATIGKKEAQEKSASTISDMLDSAFEDDDIRESLGG